MTLAQEERKRRIALLVILAIGSWMLWQTPFGSLLLYPFTILSTWFHEMGHGLAALLTGSPFERLVIYPDGSGVAVTYRHVDSSRFSDAFIAAGGPLGPPIAGALLILASRTHRSTTIALTVLAAALCASSIIWVRSPIGLIVLPAIGLGLFIIARSGSEQLREFTIQFLGVQACISTWRQTGYLFSRGGVIGGLPQQSDTEAIAGALLLPYWFWAICISVGIAILLWWSFRKAFG